MKNSIELVKKVITATSKSEDQKELLIATFTPHIIVDAIKIKEGVIIGTSLAYGRPHLPSNFKWPDKYYFFAQFNFVEIKPYDFLDILPSTGIVHLFFDPTAKDYRPNSPTAAKMFYYNGETKDLTVATIPDKKNYSDKEKHYYSQLAGDSYQLKFSNGFTIYPAKDATLIKALENMLGAKFEAEPGDTIFGEPQTWQGEDQDNMLYGEEDYVESKDVDEVGGSAKQDDMILFYQTSFGEGTFHFWIGKNSLANQDFSNILTTASVT